MPLIEVMGFPRSGKTTSLKRLEEQHPNFIWHPDLLEIVTPEYLENTDSQTINFWYAQYCADRQKKILGKSEVNIMERGILDRIAYGRASLAARRMEDEKFPDYLNILTPWEDTNDLTILFLTSPETSFARIRTPKKSPTQHLEFLYSLYASYVELSKSHPEIVVIPEGTSPDEQFRLLQTTIADYLQTPIGT